MSQESEEALCTPRFPSALDLKPAWLKPGYGPLEAPVRMGKENLA